MYTAHVQTLTVPIEGTFRGKTAWITPREYRVVCTLMKRASWNQRDLAQATGYADVSGLNRALHSLRKLGIIALSTTRGRYGSTVAWLRRGVHAANTAMATLVWSMLPIGSNEEREVELVPGQIGNIRDRGLAAIPAGHHVRYVNGAWAVPETY